MAEHTCTGVRVLRTGCQAAGALIDSALERLDLALQHGGAHEALAETIDDIRAARLLIAVEEMAPA